MKRLSCLLIIACAAVAAPVHAQEMSLGASSGYGGGGSGIYYPNWGAEIFVAAYRPSLETTNPAYRKLNFPENTFFEGHPIKFGGQFNWYALQGFGLLGLYGRAGYWHLSSPSRLCTDSTSGKVVNCTSVTVFESTQGDDTQAINIVPVSVGIVYKFDILRRNLGWPVIAAAKWGIDYNVWWATVGEGNAHTPDGQRAIGGIVGSTLAFSVGYSFDANQGGNMIYGHRKGAQDTYLFVEYDFIFGDQLLPTKQKYQRLDLSDPWSVSVGMSLDFS